MARGTSIISNNTSTTTTTTTTTTNNNKTYFCQSHGYSCLNNKEIKGCHFRVNINAKNNNIHDNNFIDSIDNILPIMEKNGCIDIKNSNINGI